MSAANDMMYRVALAICRTENTLMLGKDRNEMCADPRALAKAAIEAMREPTDGQKGAMARAWGEPFSAEDEETIAVAMWKSGIDAILSKPQ